MLLRITVAGLSAAALTACAANKTVDADTRARYNQQSLRMAGGSIAIVSDACVLRDEVGEDFVLLGPSRTASAMAAKQVNDRLRQRGLSVAKSVTPFLCGTLKPEDASGYKVMETRNLPAASSALPVIEDPNSLSNPPLAQAYRDLLFRVTEAKLPDFTQQGQPELSALNLPTDSLALLKRELGVSSVWVIQFSAGEVSAGKSIGAGLLTGLLTAGATGGAGYLISVSKDGHRQQAILVDLDRAEIVWKKSTGVLPGAYGSALLTEAWAKDLLSPFLIIGGMPFAAAQISDEATQTKIAEVQVPEASAVLAVTAAVPLPATTNARIWTLTEAVYVRSNPALDGAVNGLVPAGVVLNIAGTTHNTSGEWWYVAGGGQKGWIRAIDNKLN